jgi:hypothetical protein
MDATQPVMNAVVVAAVTADHLLPTGRRTSASLCSRQSTHHPTIALSHIGARCRYGIQVRGEALTNTVPESNWRSTLGSALPIKSYTVRYGTVTEFEPAPSLPVNLYSLSKSVGRRWVVRTLKTNRPSANSSTYPLMISGRRYGVPPLPHLFGLSHANACTSNAQSIAVGDSYFVKSVGLPWRLLARARIASLMPSCPTASCGLLRTVCRGLMLLHSCRYHSTNVRNAYQQGGYRVPPSPPGRQSVACA